MQLCGISQDAKSIRNVFEKYDNDFAIPLEGKLFFLMFAAGSDFLLQGKTIL